MKASLLHRPALVLNGSWSALRTTTVRHAVELLVRGAALAIRPHTYELHDFESWVQLELRRGEPCLCTVRLRFPVPRAVVLHHYHGPPRWNSPSFSRRNVYRRDGYRCQYCGRGVGEADRTIDHVLPRSRGGHTNWDNCVLACRPCNRRKADRLPEEAGMALLRHPDEPDALPVPQGLDEWTEALLPRALRRHHGNGHAPNGHHG